MGTNKFFIFKLSSAYLYCIGINDINGIVYDLRIAQLLDIDEETYIKLVYKFGGINDERKGLSFIYKYDAQRFADYLNENYLLILKLAGKIT